MYLSLHLCRGVFCLRSLTGCTALWDSMSYGILTVTILQAVISVSVDMLPLPGGMGISETLYMVMFVPVFGPLFAAIYAAQPWDFLLRTDADQCTYDLCGTSYHWKKKRRDTKDVINCNEGRTFEKGETGYAWIL